MGKILKSFSNYESNSKSDVGLMRVLVVDDELDILEMTRIMLESLGFEVITASDGEKALEIV